MEALVPRQIIPSVEKPLDAEKLSRTDLRKLQRLMKRDGVAWPEFLRRAVEAYDLMYSRTE